VDCLGSSKILQSLYFWRESFPQVLEYMKIDKMKMFVAKQKIRIVETNFRISKKLFKPAAEPMRIWLGLSS
jgi:hypothetical protein